MVENKNCCYFVILTINDHTLLQVLFQKITVQGSSRHRIARTPLNTMPITDENVPSNINAAIESSIDLMSPAKASRKHRNSSFLHRLRFRKGSDKDRKEKDSDKDSLTSLDTDGLQSSSSYNSSSNIEDGVTSASASGARGIKRFQRKGSSAKKYKALPNDAASGIRIPLTNSNANSNASGHSDANLEQQKLKLRKEEPMTTKTKKKQDLQDRGPHVVKTKVKKRKSDEGIASQQEVLVTSIPIENFNVNPTDQSPTVSVCSDQKRYRESTSPIINNKKSAIFPLPPVESLELNCNESTHSHANARATRNGRSPLTESPIQEDLDSSLSSSSPMSMEPGAFSSFYYDDTVDGEDGHADLNSSRTSTPTYNREYEAVGDERGNGQNEQIEQEEIEDDEENDADNFQDDEEEDNESDESTVVNDLPPARLQKPPPGATKEQQDRFYWELCYGQSKGKNQASLSQRPPISWSATRKAPAKSCLSAKKTPWTKIANSAKKRVELRSRLASGETDTGNDNGTPGGWANTASVCTPKFSTPQGNDTDIESWSSDVNRSVKFGDSSAAEFESSRPTVELTPLPPEQAREQFRVDEKEVESDEESVELHLETARNADTLAQWEDDFDSFCDERDSDDDEQLEALVQRKRPNVRGSGRSTGSSASRRDRDRRSSRGGRGDRRSSAFFSKEGGSLLSPDDMELDERQKTNSPEKTQNNTTLIVTSGETNEPRASLSSTESSLQFSSPSTIGGSFLRLSSSGSESSKATPTTDLTSSSNILRSMHSAGGASIGRDAYNNRQDESNQDFKPSQLNFALQKAKNGSSPSGIRPQTEQNHDNSTHQSDLLSKLTMNPSMVVNAAELLLESKTEFSLQHKISSLLSIEGVPPEECSSLLAIASDLDGQVHSSQGCVSDIGHDEVAHVVQMSVITLMEEYNKNQDDVDEEKIASIVEKMEIHLDQSEIEDVYALLAEHSNMKWLVQEMEALELAKDWLLPLYKSNRKEEDRIANILNRIDPQCLKIKEKRRHKLLSLHKDQLGAVCELEATIENEMYQLEVLKHQAHFLTCKCEVELSKPHQMLKSRLLETLIPYDCEVQSSPLKITYPHLDRSQTLVSWEAASDTPLKRDKRESICTTESSDSTIALLMNTPKTKRLKVKQEAGQQVLPVKSVARKLYCRFLDGDCMKIFLAEQFKFEQEMGILTVSDAFQRLNLMALDILELQKYYNCRLEMPPKSNLVQLQVTISLGQLCSVAVRFIYDTSSQKGLLCPVPIEVFVEPISGEPAVPINTLLQIAKHALISNAGTNAFILRRTCSAIVDSLTKY